MSSAHLRLDLDGHRNGPPPGPDASRCRDPQRARSGQVVDPPPHASALQGHTPHEVSRAPDTPSTTRAPGSGHLHSPSYKAFSTLGSGSRRRAGAFSIPGWQGCTARSSPPSPHSKSAQKRTLSYMYPYDVSQLRGWVTGVPAARTGPGGIVVSPPVSSPRVRPVLWARIARGCRPSRGGDPSGGMLETASRRVG